MSLHKWFTAPLLLSSVVVSARLYPTTDLILQSTHPFLSLDAFQDFADNISIYFVPNEPDLKSFRGFQAPIHPFVIITNNHLDLVLDSSKVVFRRLLENMY